MLTTVKASNFGGVPNFGGSKKNEIHYYLAFIFLDKLSFACFKSNSLSKNECKIQMNLILFDPPKLGTPPKLEALTINAF